MRASERKGFSKDLLCRRRRRFEHVKNPPFMIDLKREQVQRVTLDPCTFTFSTVPFLILPRAPFFIIMGFSLMCMGLLIYNVGLHGTVGA